MSIIGIVCEYNPFHKGHEYHIKKSRAELGEDSVVVCVMSGDYVQRGEAAVFSKYSRAEAACLCGADIVVELPLPWSLSSAEGFADAAVELLAGMKCSHISFGSEAGETKSLSRLARCILQPDFQEQVKALLSENPCLSYAAARQLAAERKFGSDAMLLSRPNNILAVEYLKAIFSRHPEISPYTIERKGSGHDSSGGASGEKSAEEIRRMIAQGEDISAEIPEKARLIYLNEESHGRVRVSECGMESAILSRLRMFDEAYYSSLPDSGGGAGLRFYKAAREEATLSGLISSACTKRYSAARMRRICMYAALGIKKEMLEKSPPYARVLAANGVGRSYLRSIAESTAIPILTKPAAVKGMSDFAKEIFTLGASAHDLFVLGYADKEERRAGNDWRTGPKIV